MRDADDVVYWLQERALRRYGATMNAAHTETQEWLWADEITRLREENARLREALKPIVKIKAFTCIYEWTPVEALRDDEEVRVKLTGAQIKKMREAAIREGGKDE